MGVGWFCFGCYFVVFTVSLVAVLGLVVCFVISAFIVGVYVPWVLVLTSRFGWLLLGCGLVLIWWCFNFL